MLTISTIARVKRAGAAAEAERPLPAVAAALLAAVIRSDTLRIR